MTHLNAPCCRACGSPMTLRRDRGRHAWRCGACEARKKREAYAEQRDTFLQRSRRYREANRPADLERKRLYREANKEAIRARERAAYRKKKDSATNAPPEPLRSARGHTGGEPGISSEPRGSRNHQPTRETP